LQQSLGLSEVALGNFLLHMSVKLIVHHPEAYLESTTRSMVSYWFPYVTKYSVGHFRESSVLNTLWDALEDLIDALFLFGVLMLAGLAAGYQILNRKFNLLTGPRVVFVMALAVIFQTQFLSCFMVGGQIPRYRSVTDLLIISAVVLGADWIWTTWRASSHIHFLQQGHAHD